MRRLVAVVVTLAVVWPAAAHAAGPFDKYEQAAAAYFGGAVPDCPGGYRYHWWAGVENNPFDIPTAVAYAGECEMWFDWGWWREQGRIGRCAIYVHEYAHLLGYEHDPVEVDGDPVDRVYVKLNRREPKQCVALVRRFVRPRPDRAP